MSCNVICSGARNVFYNAWKICFVILSTQYFHDVLGGITCTCWLLGKARIKLKRPGNARFELQVVDIPHGQEDIINGDGLFFKVQHCTNIM